MDLADAKLGRLAPHGIYVHIVCEKELVYVSPTRQAEIAVAYCGATTHNDKAEQVQSWFYVDDPAAAREGLCPVCARKWRVPAEDAG